MKLKEDVGERPEIWEIGLGEGKPDMADTDWNEEEKVFEAYHVSSWFYTLIAMALVVGSAGHSFIPDLRRF